MIEQASGGNQLETIVQEKLQLTEKLQNIFENSNLHSVEDSQSKIKQFDDSLEQFIKILKKTTSAYKINIYSKDLIQIHTDYMSMSAHEYESLN
jgi:hypothetical protein